MSNNIFFERGQMADKPNNYLWLGDCLELMKDIPNKSIDAIICDLPYGTTACKWDSVIPFEPLWEQYKRIIKDNGAIVLFGREPFTSMLVTSNIKDYKHKWVWNKKQTGNFANAKYMPLQIEEDIIVFSKNKVNYYPIMRKGKMRKRGGAKETNNAMGNNGLKKGFENYSDLYYPTNIYELANPRLNKLHPTEKPLPLIEMLVKTYTNENDWVLDNTCGSNTTGVACYDLNRNYIGIEKEINIYNVAKKRMEKNILLRVNEPKTLFEQ